MKKRFPFLLLGFASLSMAGEVTVGKSSAITATAAESSVFDQGRIELQSATGAYFSFGSGDHSPNINYSLSTYRLGCMLNSPSGDGWWRGNTELIVEGFLGSMFEGPGDFLGGANVALRYNFVPAGSPWVPYVQAGAGGFFNDIHRDQPQDMIGKAWELNLQGSAGVRYLLREHWAVSPEGGYQRAVSPGSSQRNAGLNAVGAQIGLSRFF
jgi:hypothetical protein